MINKLEQKRQELLDKYKTDIYKDFSKIETIGCSRETNYFKDVLCPEFIRLCITSEPEFGIKVIKSLYEKTIDVK